MARIDMNTGVEGEVARDPTPDEIWNFTFLSTRSGTDPVAEGAEARRDYFATIPFVDRGGFFRGCYYQHSAVERVLAAIAVGDLRILLTFATGTGKTFIAF